MGTATVTARDHFLVIFSDSVVKTCGFLVCPCLLLYQSFITDVTSFPS